MIAFVGSVVHVHGNRLPLAIRKPWLAVSCSNVVSKTMCLFVADLTLQYSCSWLLAFVDGFVDLYISFLSQWFFVVSMK